METLHSHALWVYHGPSCPRPRYSTLIPRISLLSLILTGLQPAYACLDADLDEKTQFRQCLDIAVRGEAEAQFELARLYAEGRGTPRDTELASQWYLSAAEYGHPRAQYALAKLFENRVVADQDYTRALEAFRELSQLGPDAIQANLGTTFDQCMEIAAETSPAIHWYQRAAEQGLVDAQLELGFVFEIGRGVPADDTLAYMWFDIAARHGKQDAGEFKQSLSQRLPEQQRLQAERLADNWMQAHR